MKTLGRFIDREYPARPINHTRIIARGIVFNDRDQIALTKIFFDDKFGHRDYYETPGGGVNQGETLEQGFIRECEEELGLKVKILRPIGIIRDFYNLIQRENHNHYFMAKVVGPGTLAREEKEKAMIQSIVWLSLEDAIDRYRAMTQEPLARLVRQRELPVLLEVQKMQRRKGWNFWPFFR